MKQKSRIIQLLLVASLAISLVGCSQNNNAAAPSEQVKNVTSSDEKYKQAIEMYNQGKLDEAKSLLEECIQQDSTKGDYDYYLGNVYRKKNDLEKALLNYQNAYKKSPKLIEAYNNAVAVQIMTQSYDQALNTANAGLKEQPDYTELKFKKAQILFVKKQFKETIPLLTELAKDETNFEANRFLGLSYLELKDKKNALGYLKKYLQQAPEGVPAKETVKKLISKLESGK